MTFSQVVATSGLSRCKNLWQIFFVVSLARAGFSYCSMVFWHFLFSLFFVGRYVTYYNPPNNFFGLSWDKTDHVIQNRTMVIRRYPPADLISLVWFYFDGIKAKKRASVQAKLLIGHGTQKNTFCRSQWRKKLKSWLTIPHKETRKNTKKSTQYPGTIYVRLPWEIIRRVIK